MINSNSNNGYYKHIALAFSFVLISAIFSSGISNIISRWSNEDEYSHGPLLIFLFLYFVYEKRHIFFRSSTPSPILGFSLVTLSSLMYLAGEVSALFILIHYAYVFTIVGIYLILYGHQSLLKLTPLLVLVFFSIPIPYFIQTNLTINLQLISSFLGVQIIKLFSIPVFHEGNIIDLGIIQLQVVEACAGLRYMFSLLSFGYVCAYIYNAEKWKKWLVFLSTIPITILMNSFRIAMVGILVHYYGFEMAEGFSHYFQGIAIFLLCLIILFVEMWLLTKVGIKQNFKKAFIIQKNKSNITPSTKPKKTLFFFYPAAISLILVTFLLVQHYSSREENIPNYKPFVKFPLIINDWKGVTQALNSDILNELKLSDYIAINYITPASSAPVNLYVAYYETQRKGESPHSPRVCIPGDGWEISKIDRLHLDLNNKGSSIKYNRAIIKKKGSKQLVYYWFQQRGRTISNEYLMKWYLFKDSIALNRTDGALVRIVTPIIESEDISLADQRLQNFANDATPYLNSFIPN